MRHDVGAVVDLGVLEDEIFTEADAAAILQVAPSTLHYWLEGKRSGSRVYKPVLRERATGRRVLTWGEFVEAGMLAEYRRMMKVPLEELRRFINQLRDDVGPYPLAQMRPYVGSGRRLLVKAQEQSGLRDRFWLVAPVGGQPLLLPVAEDFFRRVDWDGGVAARWKPHNDPASLVLVDPHVRFGRPAVRGLSTEVVWDEIDSGADLVEVATTYDRTYEEVYWAWTYEQSVRLKAAA